MNRLLLFAFFIGSIAFSQEKKESFTIYFDSNSFELSEKEQTKLIPFFSNQDLTHSIISIDGFCDDIGTSENNLILSKRRAETVGDFLKNNFKIVSNKISGNGEVELKSISTKEIEKSRMLNRRVTLTIEYTIPSKSRAMNAIPSTAKDSSFIDDNYKTFDSVLKIGDKIIIEHLIFQASRTVFENNEKAETELKKIVAYFQKNPTITFEISGHVCCITKSFKDARDKDTGLNNLSESRAKRIYDYFLSNGIAKERMSHKGYGRKFPLPNVAESENKRVEIVITSI